MPGFEWFGDEERKEVNDVLETGVLFRYGFDNIRNDHWKAKTFEKKLSEIVDVKYCHLCSSGTAALSVALAACGVGAGDEVIVPPFTFIATIEAVLNAGAVPVFAEIDDTLCLDPEAIRQSITSRTQAVIPVHMCGAMARIREIKEICDQNGLILIEDACQSLGARYNGKALGTFGRMGCFSFDPVKTVTCGEGGAVITDDEALYQNAFAYADHGHDHVGNDRGAEDHPILGANYRISELNAAVGVAQLGKLDRMIQTQRQFKTILKDSLAGSTKMNFRNIPDADGDSATFFTFFLPDEKTTRKAAAEFSKAGVDGCFYWYDNNWHYLRKWRHLKEMKTAAKLPIQILENAPDYSKTRLPVSDGLISRAISMQIKLSWQENDVIQRAQTMKTIVDAL